MSKPDITAEELRKLLHYDPETGIFTWRVQRSNVKRGAIAGCVIHHGYRVIRAGGRLVLAHRLAWLYMTGEWPTLNIDHIDGDTTNNRFSNLRDVTHQANSHNLTRLCRHNSSGFMGVSKHRDVWKAQIKVAGEVKQLGTFSTPEAAAEAYKKAKLVLHIPAC